MIEETLSASFAKELTGKLRIKPAGNFIDFAKRADRVYRNKLKEEAEAAEASSQPRIKPFWRIKPVSIEIFVREYMRSIEPSEEQWKVLKAVFPDMPEKDKQFFGVKEIILRIGQGGGKNTVMLIVCNYAFYMWCCLEDPHEYFNLQKDESFDVLIYSQVTQKQAKRVFYGRLSRVMKNTIDPGTGHNWYSQYMGFKIKEYGKKDIKEESMNIPHRNRMYGGISVYVLDTTAKGVEGYTIWMRITDEPSRANTPIKYATARQQYDTAQTNLTQRFPGTHGLGMTFSYPEQETNDLLIELYNQNIKLARPNTFEINNGVMAAWYYTYIFNSKPGLENEYNILCNKPDADIIDINRRWKADVPPNKFGFFMPYFVKIDECANPKLKNPVEYKSSLTVRGVDVRGEKRNRSFTALEILKVIQDDKVRFWGWDASETGDSFIIISGYPTALERAVEVLELEHYENGEIIKEKIAINCKPVVDIIIKYKPSKEYPVDYVNVEDILTRLLGDEFRKSRGSRSDKYQSASLNQKMLDIGVRGSEAIFPSNPVQLRNGKIVRHLVWNNAVEYLDDPELIREMKKLLLINNNKLDHPEGESKDIWDAMVNCVCQIIEAGINMSKLDIEGIESSKDTDELNKRRMEMYRKGLGEFQRKYNRTYNDANEFCKFMRESGYKFTEYDVQICEIEMEVIDDKITRGMFDQNVNTERRLDIGDDFDPRQFGM